MDEGIRSKKSLSLGMRHGTLSYYPNRNKQLSLGMPGRHPLFLLTTIVILLGAIFLFVTYHEFCLERLVSLLVFIFSLCHLSLLDTPI